MENAILEKLNKNLNPGSESSFLKIMASQLGQELSALKIEALGNYMMPFNTVLALNGEDYVGPEESHTATGRYLNNRASTIFGGSTEVQKNIIAKSVLGL